MAKNTSRKLAAILAADVVGYSRLMGEDEAGTLDALRAHRKELIEPKIAEHAGRIVKLMGDGLLAEFPSAVEAVHCAVEIQHTMGERNATVPAERRMIYRIGINIGDIIVEGDDIYGDGVNVAARLEGLAEPGGICVSRTVFNHVKGKLDLTFEHLGEKEVKNIAEPVTVYRVALDDKAAALVTPVARQAAKPARRHWSVAAAAVVVILLAAGGTLWWQPWKPDVAPASIEHMAFPLPDRPSIAVLAFDNMSGDPAQDYFADGITESVITELSRFRNLFVIARNSTFTYKGKAVKVQQVAEDLGVQYVLEGSVQRSKDRIRINVQLIDAITGWHLWAERYDRELNDFFAVQDEVTRQIVATLATQSGRLAKAWQQRTARKGTVSLKAYDLDLRGGEAQGPFTKEAFARAEELFEKAIAADPEYARPYANFAMNLVWQVYSKFAPEEALGRAVDLAKEAIARDDAEAWGHWALGVAYLKLGSHDLAIAEYERALELNPNDADVLAETSFALAWVGRAEEGIENVKAAMRLNPRYPDWYLWGLGVAYYDARRYDEAIATLESRKQPNLKSNLYLAAAYAQQDRQEQAQATVQKILDENPESSIERYGRAQPYKNETDLSHYIDGLRKAGIPERPPLALPDKPSIAVLPFSNMSGDPAQDYFADGITEDLTTDLSKISGLFVIARNSTFSYKGKQVDVRDIASELGVKYVLEGSVRRAGDKVRINAQLIDAATGGHLWAERYDGTLDDVFALQDKVTQNIVTALAVTLTPDEARQAATAETDNVAAYDAFLQGWARYNRQTPKDFAEAIPFFEKAIELDPDYGRAYGALALTYHVGSERGLSGALKVPWYVLRIRARKYLDLALNNPTAPAQVVAALMALKQRLFGDAVAYIERAVALDPNDAEAHSMMAYVLVYDDRPEDAIKHAQQALRLDPNNPSRPLQWIGRAHFALGNLEESLIWLERAREHNPSVFPAALVVASARAHLGQVQEARAALEVYTDRWSSPPPLEKIMYYWSFKDPVVAKRFTDGILQAGLSDESGTYYQVSEDDRLSGAQIDDLLRGRKIGGDGPWDGKPWWRDYGEDSTLSWRGPPVDKVPWHGPSVETDQGVSRVKGDLLCETWGVINEGYETCFPVFRNPEGTAQGRDEYLFMTDTGIYPWSLLE